MQVKLKSFPVKNVLLVSALFFSFFGMMAEEIDSLRTFNLDSIVVLSIKQPNNNWTTPVSATTISTTFMEQQHLNDMKDFRPLFLISLWWTEIQSSPRRFYSAGWFPHQYTGRGHVCGRRSSIRKIFF
jgi:hypothetical protein